MVELFANSGDPYQTPRSVASDLCLHCLPVILLGVSRLQWIKKSDTFVAYAIPKKSYIVTNFDVQEENLVQLVCRRFT